MNAALSFLTRRMTICTPSPAPTAPGVQLRSLRRSDCSIAAAHIIAGLLLGFALTGVQGQTANPATAASSAPVFTKTPLSTPSRPLWSELTNAQHASLKPLATRWDSLSEAHKRRWLALSKNYASLSTAEQHTLHGRMTEWAALTGRERVQARLNFAEVNQLAPDERTAKWETYQALSDEDKRKLADNASVRPRGAAVPVRPVAAQKLVQVPPPPRKGEHGPRIQLAPPAGIGLTTSKPGVPDSVPAAPVPNPGVTTSAATAPVPISPVTVPMVRMTDQPSSAP